MKKLTFKFAIAVFTFIFGILAAGLWAVYPFLVNHTADDVVPTNSVVTEEADQYAVYSTVISELYLKNDRRIKLLRISEQTPFFSYPDAGNEQMTRRLKQLFPSVNEEVLADYDVKRMQPSKLYRSFNIPVKYVFYNDSNYLQQRANVNLEVSRVGFDYKRNQAFVYTNITNGGYEARGDFVFLEKTDGVWTIEEVFNAYNQGSVY